MIYVFDTNSLSALDAYYPKVFTSFWAQFDAAASAGDIISTREVKAELDRSGLANVLAWARSNSAVFTTPSAAETAFVATILAVPHFQTLINSRAALNGTPVADPFVIACAKVKGGTVVTEEKPKPNSAKIPNVCAHFQVPCINLEMFMQTMGWTF
jgi:hypothetical protein